MQYKYLRGTGVRVSRVSLGTMTFGDQVGQKEAERIIDCAFERGVNFIDTADVYTGGESERIVGGAISGKRDKIILATKVGGGMSREVNSSGLSRVHIINKVEQSLSALGTDYIDLYYMHFPDNGTPIEEYLYTMDNLVREGKLRYYGVSNFSAWQLVQLLWKSDTRSLIAPVVTESVYNLVTRGVEDELLPALAHNNIGLTVYNPLAGGLLSGKYHSFDETPEGTRLSLSNKGYRARYWSEDNFDAIAELSAIADAIGIDLITLSYKWLAMQPLVDSIICGVSSMKHLEQNLSLIDAADIPEESLKEIDAVWAKLNGNRYSYHK